MSLYMVVLLVSIALAVSLALGAPDTTPTSAPAMFTSQLPATAPGLTREEGVFLVTLADDGSGAVYFIAQNTRHSIWPSDVQREQQLNPLWPIRTASRDEVLAFAEGASIGGAKMGLVQAEVPFEALADPAELALVAEAPVAVADAPAPAAEAPAPVAIEEPAPVAEVAPAPVAAAAASPMPHAPITAEIASPSLDLSPAANAEPATYVVQSGDNLIRLSARYGTSVSAILDANHITNPNRVYVGQSLVIPAIAPTPDVVESPAAPAPIANAVPEPVADAPDTALATTYTVKAGDSAIAIARQLNVDVEQLLATNAVYNRNRVYVGQVLTIPGAGA